MVTFTIQQIGNHIDVLGMSEPIFYEVQGIDLPPVTDYSFAVWHILPHAMKYHYDFHIDGPVDPIVIENAEKFSRTWEMWQPQKFREIAITSSEEARPIDNPSLPDLTLFSGGVDATYMLLELGKRMPEACALTVHGMDYRVENDEGFQRSLMQTTPFLSSLNYRRITLKSNFNNFARGSYRWGLSLAGSAFLFSSLFSSARNAADYSWEQEMIDFPAGLNHITNRYFRGTEFSLSTLSEHVTRTEKVETIASNETALHSISFCKDFSIRPQNCGCCTKCIRTKSMFLAMTGHIPPIFIDNTFTSKSMKVLSKDPKTERPFLIDLYQRARERGTLDLLPGIEPHMNRFCRRPGLKGWLSRIKK